MLKRIKNKINKRLQEVNWTKKCTNCNNDYFPSHGRQTRCPDCQGNYSKSAKLKELMK